MNRNGEERAGDEKADAEDKEWRDLLSWDGDVNKPGAMDDVNLNFALIAALFCASSGGKNSIISESVGSPSHIGVPYMEDAMDRGGAGRNANALLSSATIETSTVMNGEGGAVEPWTREWSYNGRTGHRPIPRLRLKTSYNDQTGRWTSSMSP